MKDDKGLAGRGLFFCHIFTRRAGFPPGLRFPSLPHCDLNHPFCPVVFGRRLPAFVRREQSAAWTGRPGQGPDAPATNPTRFQLMQLPSLPACPLSPLPFRPADTPGCSNWALHLLHLILHNLAKA